MKAIEYVEKYKSELCSKDSTVVFDAAKKILSELSEEAGNLIKIRHAHRDSSILAIMKEQNIKWNCIAKHIEVPSLAKDGFKNVWLTKMPELKEIWL